MCNSFRHWDKNKFYFYERKFGVTAFYEKNVKNMLFF